MMAMVAATPAAGLIAHIRAVLVVESGGSRKVTERMVTKLQRSRQDARAVGGALRRLNNHSKAMQIQILQHLLDEQDWQLALPMYKSLVKKDWYKWNPSLHARLVALMAIAEQTQEAQFLVSEAQGRLTIREELTLQVCLIENYAKCGLLDKALAAFRGLQSHSLPSARNLSCRALLRAYISLDLLHEAYLALGEMKSKGFNPCLDDYKVLLAAFGRGGLLADMEKLAHELYGAGLKLDQSGFNMMLSAYGQAKKIDCVIETLGRMRMLNILGSVHTHNAVSKSCPILIPLFESLDELPQNATSLCSTLQQRGLPDGELEAVRELLALGLPLDSVKWEQNVWELDLHHMFRGTASIALFLWLHQLKVRCTGAMTVPVTVSVVTGWGKHSDIEGRSVMKQKVLELLERMKSPFKIDSHNKGVLISRGSSLKVWLTADVSVAVSHEVPTSSSDNLSFL